MTVCQLNVAQQLLISEEHLSHLGALLLWAILVDFNQVSDSFSPAGAEAAYRTAKHLGYQSLAPSLNVGIMMLKAKKSDCHVALHIR